jgi:ParB family chromosome partitioning protein
MATDIQAQGTDASKPRRLGRGLSGLMATPVQVIGPTRAPEPDANVAAIDAPALTSIVNAQIQASPFQPRRTFDEAALNRLAESIRLSGMMQPVLVRRMGGGYELVAGERRWRAAQRAGLAAVPAIVRELSDEESAQFALVENVQREDLNPIERAYAFRGLAERFGLTQAQIAERVGVERVTVTNLMRLIDLEPEIQGMIERGELSGGHGKALLAAGPGRARVELAAKAASEGWSVRKLEQASKHRGGGVPAPASRLASLVDLEKQLGEHLGTKVSIRTDRGGQKGRIELSFYGLDHFDGIMAKLGFQPR